MQPLATHPANLNVLWWTPKAKRISEGKELSLRTIQFLLKEYIKGNHSWPNARKKLTSLLKSLSIHLIVPCKQGVIRASPLLTLVLMRLCSLLLVTVHCILIRIPWPGTTGPIDKGKESKRKCKEVGSAGVPFLALGSTGRRWLTLS